MQPALFQRHSHTLVVDVGTAQGAQLTDLLNRAGFGAQVAVSWPAARTELRRYCYNSCIIVADPRQTKDLKELTELRRIAARAWIIVVCDGGTQNEIHLLRRQGVDAVLSAPFSMLDLTSRIAAFSLRSRPTF